MNTKIPWFAVAVLALAVLAVGITAVSLVSVRTTVNSSGTVDSVSSVTTFSNDPSASLGVYSNSACTVPLTSINWGSTGAGGSVTQTIYVKNTGTGTMKLSLATTNWNPTNANGPLTVTWNDQGVSLAAGKSIAATVTLSVSSTVTGISSFSVQISVVGTAS